MNRRHLTPSCALCRRVITERAHSFCILRGAGRVVHLPFLYERCGRTPGEQDSDEQDSGDHAAHCPLKNESSRPHQVKRSSGIIEFS